jgi:hypothetical protein
MLAPMPSKKAAPAAESSGLVQSNVRMPESALDYLDVWVARLNREAGWKKYTRSDLIRDIVLERIEEQKAKEGTTYRTHEPTPLRAAENVEPRPPPGGAVSKGPGASKR